MICFSFCFPHYQNFLLSVLRSHWSTNHKVKKVLYLTLQRLSPSSFSLSLSLVITVSCVCAWWVHTQSNNRFVNTDGPLCYWDIILNKLNSFTTYTVFLCYTEEIEEKVYNKEHGIREFAPDCAPSYLTMLYPVKRTHQSSLSLDDIEEPIHNTQCIWESINRETSPANTLSELRGGSSGNPCCPAAITSLIEAAPSYI
jgi:hypothetical protein